MSSLCVGSSISRTKAKAPQKKLKVNVKVRKTRVKRVTALQKIFRTRNQANSQYYFSKASGVNEENQRDVTKELTPYKYPTDIETFSYKVIFREWRKKLRALERQMPIHSRPTYRTRQTQDILRRTFVPDPEDVMKTVADIDPEYFTIVEGRPICTKHSPLIYINNLRQCLITKLMAAFREDEILRAEETVAKERLLIEDIKRRYQEYVNSFEEFLSKDHQKSMLKLSEADAKNKQTLAKDDLFKELSRQCGITKVAIYILEEEWRNAKMYQKFLYQTSPVTWRLEHDYIHKRLINHEIELVTDWSSLFGRYRLASMGSIASLDSLIGLFLEDIRVQEPPLLYFTEPNELIRVFRAMETQNLNSLLNSEDLAVPLENMLLNMEQTKTTITKEFQIMKEMIDDVEENIQWFENRSIKLKEQALHLIETQFKRLVAGDESLNLFVYVEDLYEAVIAPNDANLDIYLMMKGIEVQYEAFLLELDTISLEHVRKAESEAYSEEFRVMKQAKDAARKVALIHELTHKLKRVLEPPVYQTTRILRPRSVPLRPKVIRTPVRKDLTQEEQDYLEFFTEYCLNDDVRKYGICFK